MRMMTKGEAMKKNKWWIAGALLALVAVLVFALRGGAKEVAFREVAIERGAIEEVVSSTGALQATETVEVGTQVSGQIADIYVDFNDRVTEGQLLARIDPTLLNNEVRLAEANLARSRAELDQAERTLERTRALHADQVVTDSELEQAEYSRSIAASSYAAAAASVERARRNLEYTEIRSPNDGVVVERSVDVGQTVAASMSAPTLFVIAQDLSEMEILASVSESDIARIHDGQDVRFTVQAYGDRTFTGTVRQVRLQSTMQDNVVNYSVVVGVENPDGALLPGMTATVEFLIAQAEDVLRVPNAALRFQPTAEMPVTGRDGSRAAPGQARSAQGDGASGGVLWQVDESGALTRLSVETGLTDGQYTEVNGPGLSEGMRVVAGVASSAAEAGGTNPFQGQQSQGSGGPSRGF